MAGRLIRKPDRSGDGGVSFERGSKGRAKRLASYLAAGSVFVTATSTLAQAQPTTAGPTPQNVTDSSAQSGEVILVTAQKRSEPLLNVPVAVTAVNVSDLQKSGASSLRDYATMVPGLSLISDQQGSTQIVLRGITTGPSNSSTTSTYIDDAPFGSSTSFASGGYLTPDLDPATLQQIEVLRGPQGTLYGASSLGGLIKYVTIQPSLTLTSGRIELDGIAAQNAGLGYGVRGSVSVPVVRDQLGFNISGFARRDPGYIDNPLLGLHDVNSADVNGGRAALLWRPSGHITIKLSALLQNLKSYDTSDEDLDQNLRPIGKTYEQFRYIREPNIVRDRLYSGSITYSAGDASLSSITSLQRLYNKNINDSTAAYGPTVASIFGTQPLAISLPTFVNSHKISQEFRAMSSGTAMLQWQLGLFYTRESSDLSQQLLAYDLSSLAPVDLGNIYTSDAHATYTEYAGYADLTAKLTSRIEATAGARYTSNKQHFVQPSSGVFAGGESLLDNRSSDKVGTFLGSLKYTFASHAILYARVASGYRPGGPNALFASQIAAGLPATFKPDNLVDYEVGFKGRIAPAHLTLDISAFHINWQKIQLVVISDGTGFIGNGSSAVSSGIEFAGEWAPTRELKARGNFAYTDAHLSSDAPGINGKAGDELPEVAKFAGSLSLDYTFFGNALHPFVGGTLSYVGRRKSEFVSFTPEDFTRPTIPAYVTLDLRAGLVVADVDVEAYIRNLNNSHGINRISSLQYTGYAPFAASIIPPRTFGISVSKKF